MTDEDKRQRQILTETRIDSREIDGYVSPYEDVDIDTNEGMKALIMHQRGFSTNFLSLLRINGSEYKDYDKITGFIQKRKDDGKLTAGLKAALIFVGVCYVLIIAGIVNVCDGTKAKLLAAGFFVAFTAVGAFIIYSARKERQDGDRIEQEMVNAMNAGKCELRSFTIKGRKYYRHVNSGDTPDDVYYYVLTDNMTFDVNEQYIYFAADEGKKLVVLTWHFEDRDRIQCFVV